MPLSSWRLISAAADGGAGWAVCAKTSVDELANVTKPAIAIARDRYIDGCPPLSKRCRTCNNRNHIPATVIDKTPTSGHPISLQRAVSAFRPFARAPVAGTFREGTEFGEDAHQQLFTTLHVQFAVDAPQVGVYGVRRQTEPFGGVLLRIAVEHGAHDAAFARRQAETRRERAPLPWNEDRLARAGHYGFPHGA